MQKLVQAVIQLFILLVSLALLAYGAWWWKLEQGARAVAQGNWDAAAEIYASVEQPFTRLPWLTRAFPEHYSQVIFAQVALLYGQGRRDEAIGKIERSATAAPYLAERPEYSFWSGNTLLRRALRKGDPEVAMKNLSGAGAHYRKGLEAAPDDWDLKYNYELVQHILAQRDRDRKKEEAKVKSILERIRTITEPGEKELPPPEKRG